MSSQITFYGGIHEIAVTGLTKENIDESFGRVIAEKVWNELDSRDIRDVIKVSSLASSSEDVSFVVNMLKKTKSKSEYSFCGN